MNMPEELILEDIITPSSIDIWPPAIGWWLLLITLIILIIASILFIKRYRKKWGYRNNALTLLKAEYKQWQLTNDDQQCLMGMSAIVKRTAITAYPLAKAQSLHGKKWADFLNQQCKTINFSDDLFINSYQKSGDINIDDLYKAYKNWIKNHQLPTGKAA